MNRPVTNLQRPPTSSGVSSSGSGETQMSDRVASGPETGSAPGPLRPRRGRGRWLWTLGLLVVIAGGGAWYMRSRNSRSEAPRFETMQVERGRIVARVTATGTVSPLVTVQVGSQISGRIQSLYADFNSKVKKGQVIAKLDPQINEAMAEQARANFLAAKANVAKAKAQALNAQRQYERSRTLAEEKLVSAADRDTAESEAEAAQAGVQAAEGALAQARAALNQTEVNLAYTTIYSPINGVVISRTVDVGQTVAAQLQAPTLFTIAEDLAHMQVDTNVAESDVGKLAAGMEVTFTVDAYPGERFKGTVRQIRNAPQTVQNVVTYDAVIDVANPDLKLKPGMTANATFVYAHREDVLRVPNAALRFRPPPELQGGRGGRGGGPGQGQGQGQGQGRRGGENGQGSPQGTNPGEPSAREGRGRRGAESEPSDRRTVWVLRGTQPASVRIRPGVTDGSFTEVLEGELKEGDAIITEVAQTGPQASPAGGAGGPGGGGGRGGGGNPFRRGF
jgi:HlyD family secretion protein